MFHFSRNYNLNQNFLYTTYIERLITVIISIIAYDMRFFALTHLFNQ